MLMRATALSLGPAVALGFARFAYALVLPAMRADLGWSYAFAGAMNTANAVGYLVGALATDVLVRRAGPRATFGWGLLATVATLGLTAAWRAPHLLLLLRLLNGMAAAAVFIAGATLATLVAAEAAAQTPADAGGGSGVGAPSGRRVVGTYFGGVGIGIAISGAVVPFLVTIDAPAHWPRAWLVMALLGLIALAVAWSTARRVDVTRLPRGKGHVSAQLGRLRPALLAYLLFGFGYIGYMTFLVAFVHGAGWGKVPVAGAWVVLGIAAAATARVWEPVLRRLPIGAALALILTSLTIGSSLPLLSTLPPVVIVSTLMVGASFLAVVSALTEVVRTTLPPAAWGHAIALSTVVFATGQALGPLATGVLADHYGGLAATLAASAASLALAVPIALAQGQASQPAAPAAR